MAKGKKLVLFRGDKTLWIIVAILCITSILVVYSSTVSMAYRKAEGDTSFFVLRQLRFILAGFFATIVVHWIEPRFYLRMVRIFFFASVTLALLAYTPWFGATINEASRWVNIPGLGITILPAEPLKISLVMLLASRLNRVQIAGGGVTRLIPSLSMRSWRERPEENIAVLSNVTRPIILPILIATAVIMPANLSTSVIIFTISLIILLVGRVPGREVFRFAAIVGVVMVVIITIMYVSGVGRAQVWVNRVESYITSAATSTQDSTATTIADDEFQKTQARIAIASGGIIGKGPGNSTQRSQLPHPYSDFAYAFIVEEYGVVGGFFVLALYLWVLYRAGVIMRKSVSMSHALLVLGLSLITTLSAFVNMMVSVGIIPVTGQSLPLISLGGTSVFFVCVSFGMMLGVSRVNDERERQQRLEALRLRREEEAAAQQLLAQEEPQTEEHSQYYDQSYDDHNNSTQADYATPPQQWEQGDDDNPFIVSEGEGWQDNEEEDGREVYNLEEDDWEDEQYTQQQQDKYK